MSNEAIRVWGTQISLESAGSTIANNAISSVASTNTVNTLTQSGGVGFPHGMFTLTVAPGTGFTADKSLDLILQPLDIDGTTDAPAPTTSYLERYVGSFRPIGSTTGSMTYSLEVYDLPPKFAAYIFNNATGQSTGTWVLKFTPFTFGPAA